MLAHIAIAIIIAAAIIGQASPTGLGQVTFFSGSSCSGTPTVAAFALDGECSVQTTASLKFNCKATPQTIEVFASDKFCNSSGTVLPANGATCVSVGIYYSCTTIAPSQVVSVKWYSDGNCQTNLIDQALPFGECSAALDQSSGSINSFFQLIASSGSSSMTLKQFASSDHTCSSTSTTVVASSAFGTCNSASPAFQGANSVKFFAVPGPTSSPTKSSSDQVVIQASILMVLMMTVLVTLIE